MKSIIIFLVLLSFTAKLFAQQSAKSNSEQLLEYYQSQRYAEAAIFLKRTYPEPVTDLKVLAGLAYTSQMAGKLPEAETYYQRIYDQDSTNTSVLFSLGSINMRRGNNLRALTYYKKIVSKDSTNVSVYKQLATLSKNTGDAMATITYLQKANKLNPLEPDVAFDLVEIYVNLHFFQQAIKILDPALAADTANLLLLEGKAQVSFALKDYKTTAAICGKLLMQGERSNGIISWLGESWYMLKQYKDCIKTFEIMDTTKTQNETSFYYMAMSYKALHDQPNAIHYMEEAIKQGISPNIDDYYNEIGDSYDSLHQVKKSIAAYQKSLEFDEKPLTCYSLATIYDTELKNKKSALKYYKKYLAAKPPKEQKNYIIFSESRVAVLNR